MAEESAQLVAAPPAEAPPARETPETPRPALTAERTPAPTGPPAETPSPSPDATPSPAPPAASERPDGTTDGAPPAPDWRALLEQVDPKELEKHPKFAGVLGSRLERERARAVADAQRQATERAADERLRALRKEDPEQYVREVEQQEEQAARLGQVTSAIHARIATWQSSLPEPVQKAVSGKTYPGSYEDGVLAYTRDVADALSAHRTQEAVDAARAKWEKDVRPAIRKELLAELNGGEPAPDTAGGNAPSGNGFVLPKTLAEIRAMPTAVYKAHAKEIDAAVLGGRVKE